jgi:hypothetical protein
VPVPGGRAAYATGVVLVGAMLVMVGPEATRPDPRPFGFVQKGDAQTLSAQGHTVRLLRDYDRDGTADVVVLFDAQGRLQAAEVDTDRDHVVDRWERYAAGSRLERIGIAERGGNRPSTWYVLWPDGTVASVEKDAGR